MLTEIYIEALLVDEELADQVWEAWFAREIDDLVASILWRAGPIRIDYRVMPSHVQTDRM